MRSVTMRNTNSFRSLRKYRFHPLMHSRLEFNLVQDLVICQCKEKKPPLTSPVEANAGYPKRGT